MSIDDLNLAGQMAAPLLDNSHLRLRQQVNQNAKNKRRPPSKILSAVSLN